MNVTVVGQGYVGLPVAIKIAESGFNVVGYDTDENKISQLKLGISSSLDVSQEQILNLQSKGKLQFEYELDGTFVCNTFIIAVPTPLDSNHKPDLTNLKNACKTIAKFVKSDTLIINESTSYIGTLRNLVKTIIDQGSGLDDLKYAVAPERIDPGNELWNINNTPRIISGLCEIATERAVNLYSRFCKVINQVSQPEVAEAAKLLENTFRHLNIALVNELSGVAHKFNFSIHEAVMAASSKPFGFMPFYPSIGVGGHCIPVDPTYLSYSAETVGINLNLINIANQINLSTPKRVIDLIQEELGGNLKGKHIQIAGIAYKPNVSDLRDSPALLLMAELEKNGSILSWFDPIVKEYGNQISTPLDSKIDLGLIITPHNEIDFSVWKKSGTKVLDLSANSQNYGWSKFL
jgi:UDP-N-acetyl-D-glucosamine dehydrogenase